MGKSELKRQIPGLLMLTVLALAATLALARHHDKFVQGPEEPLKTLDPAALASQLVFGLLFLLPLAQATERLTEFCKSFFAAFGNSWARPRVANCTLTPHEEALRSVLVGLSAVVVGVLVSSFAGVDFVHLVFTGKLVSAWWAGDHQWGHPAGLVVTGLLLAGGAKPIHDLLESLLAYRDRARANAAAAAPPAAPCPPPDDAAGGGKGGG